MSDNTLSDMSGAEHQIIFVYKAVDQNQRTVHRDLQKRQYEDRNIFRFDCDRFNDFRSSWKGMR